MNEATRRLTAIMFTDLVGFTRLGQRDEDGALRLRKEHQALVRPAVAAYGGREVKTLGDGFLVEFPSAVESVRCAVEIQESVARRNAQPEVTDRILLRIGIHVGDVVEEGTDIVGDAVNVASRIEPLAEPGGICLSGTVFDQVRNKLRLPLERMGARSLKNVDYPVDLYRVVLSGEAGPASAPSSGDGAHLRFAVLPFANRSPDANDAFLADGLTDELITHVSKLPSVRVIARTSVLRFKDSSRSVREIGQELGVRLVLEGSLRKSGDRVRITAQLIDTGSEESIWSARFDRPLTDIFSIQDDIAAEIATAIAGELSRTGVTTLVPFVRAPPDTHDLSAYSDFLHGRKLTAEKGSEATMRQALEFFESAVRKDPEFARAKVGVAECTLWLSGEGALPYAESVGRAKEELLGALRLNKNLAEAHSVLAGLYLGDDDLAGSRRETQRALELNPSLTDAYRWLAQLAAGDGKIDETVRTLEAAFQLDPVNVNIMAFLGRAYHYAGRPNDALAHWARTKALVAFRTNAHLMEYFLAQRDYAHAHEALRELERIRPENSWTIMYRGFLAAREGNIEEARRSIALLDRKAASGELTQFHAGFVHFALGEMDAYFEDLERAFQLHALPLLELMYSPLYASGRDDPRMVDLLRRQSAFRAPAAEAPA
ncbi:MAG: adenylate/guanylate cyclase domain-containing protein [Thermoplasmata archaeon]